VPRIISLISSATEIVHALGQLDNLVGRSHECDFPAAVKSLPVCTRPRIDVDASSAEIDRQVKQSLSDSISIYDVFEDVIARLKPTHILTQVHCQVCAVSLRDVEAAMARGINGNPKIISLQPDSVAEIWKDILRVAAALNIPQCGKDLVAEIQGRLQLCMPKVYPTVACIEWMEPLMAAGNWMPELIAMAGGRDLFGKEGRHSPWLSWDDLVAADPEVIVISPCGFDMERTEKELYWMTNRPGWNRLRARIYIADGNQYFNRPGPRIVETQRILGEIIHPEYYEPTMRDIAWRAI
jgi:iron complex transport system substrate-binding protein